MFPGRDSHSPAIVCGHMLRPSISFRVSCNFLSSSFPGRFSQDFEASGEGDRERNRRTDKCVARSAIGGLAANVGFVLFFPCCVDAPMSTVAIDSTKQDGKDFVIGKRASTEVAIGTNGQSMLCDGL